MTEKIIERYLSQKCIGYNGNFTMAKYEEVVQYQDGSTEIVYTWYLTDRLVEIMPSAFVFENADEQQQKDK